MVLLGLTLALTLASIPAGVYTVFFTQLSHNSTASTTGQPFLWLGPTAVLLPFLTSYGAAFAFATAIYVMMLALASKQGKGILPAIKAGLRLRFEEFFSNRLLLVVISIGFLIFTASVIDAVVEAAGGSIGNPLAGGDPLKELVQLTIAPLREELGFRVVIIGLVAFVLSLGRPLKDAAKALWRPSAAYEGAAVGGVAFALIWATTGAGAVLFGACHVGLFCGGGWDFWKLPEAAYGGLVLGVLYVRYGFHVAVLAHWGVDYLASAYAFLGQGLYGIDWTSVPGFSLQDLTAFDLVGAFGTASFLAVAYVGLLKLGRSYSGRRRAASLGSNSPLEPASEGAT